LLFEEKKSDEKEKKEKKAHQEVLQAHRRQVAARLVD